MSVLRGEEAHDYFTRIAYSLQYQGFKARLDTLGGIKYAVGVFQEEFKEALRFRNGKADCVDTTYFDREHAAAALRKALYPQETLLLDLTRRLYEGFPKEERTYLPHLQRGIELLAQDPEIKRYITTRITPRKRIPYVTDETRCYARGKQVLEQLVKEQAQKGRPLKAVLQPVLDAIKQKGTRVPNIDRACTLVSARKMARECLMLKTSGSWWTTNPEKIVSLAERIFKNYDPIKDAERIRKEKNSSQVYFSRKS